MKAIDDQNVILFDFKNLDDAIFAFQ